MSESPNGTGRLCGVGVGPGDPELMTVKAMKALRRAPIVAYFAKRGGCGNARSIVEGYLDAACEEIPLVYPVTTEIPFDDPAYVTLLRRFYEASAATIAERLEAGWDVAILCEGDPLFYGSFMHLYVRLKDRYCVSTIAGITGMCGCWASAGEPITWGDDVLTVLPGTLPSDILIRKLTETDACVIMKLGRNFPKVRAAIEAAGLTGRAIYVERGTMPNERIIPLEQMASSEAPYFSLILIPGRGRRP